MARKEKDKIDTSGQSSGLSFNPFAELEVEKFPTREVEAEPIKEIKISKPAKKGRVVLRKETANRGGKTVIVISDFAPEISQNEIEQISKQLRKFCGCGGAVKNREIEIQGEQTARIRKFLTELDFRVEGIHS